jgi:hypothetical protein
MTSLQPKAAGLDQVLSRLARELPGDVEVGSGVAFEGNVVVTSAAVYVLLGSHGELGVLRAVQQSPTSYQVTRWARGQAVERRWWTR